MIIAQALYLLKFNKNPAIAGFFILIYTYQIAQTDIEYSI